ncbi:PRC-barrel domain-containing protein [Methanolobus sp. ZRKC3]|uniref:PRC-barrel domain-containing protein n=1 Tax=Methanolobus sp. ZRKC3 TaxID=3125786 RepID=UPI0032518938
MTKPKMLSVETIARDPIKNAEGKEIGNFVDFMIDLEQNCIPYVIVSLKNRDGYVGIPWGLFKSGEKHSFILDVDSSMLDSAPNFSEDKWPDVCTREYQEKIYKHFCCPICLER